jgi:formylglycine-generating enzyme required for sulfatase activity
VAATVATVGVHLRATLEPWGATAVANAQALETRVPAALATAKAPGPTVTPTRAAVSSPSPAPTATHTEAATAEPTATTLPTVTPPPTATPLPTSTATPTPYPAELEVRGGRMAFIPGGQFQMGASAASLTEECNAFRDGCQPEWFAAAEPTHAVLLGPYYIDVYEVTNESYVTFLAESANSSCVDQPCLDTEESRIFLLEGAYSLVSEDAMHPVTGVTWHGAAAYCAWRGARLPTEAEWERAAAWDAEAAAALRYPWGDVFDGQAVNFCDVSCAAPQSNTAFDDGFSETAPVMSFASGQSLSGIYEMAGNVWEWVADWYDPAYYAQSSPDNPGGPPEGEEKVVRGGSWYDTGNFTAAAIRFPSSPDNADRTIGFRCASDLP